MGPTQEIAGYSDIVQLARGFILDGMGVALAGSTVSWTELGDKFLDCARLVLANNDAEKVIQLVAGIEQLKSLNPLFRALTARAVRAPKKPIPENLGAKSGAVLAKHRAFRRRP